MEYAGFLFESHHILIFMEKFYDAIIVYCTWYTTIIVVSVCLFVQQPRDIRCPDLL